MPDDAPVTERTKTAAEILAGLTDDEAKRLELTLLAASALGDGVEAVCDFGELVFGVTAAAHHREWLAAALEHLRVGIVAPPESAKTTWLTKILVAWWIGKNPLSTNGICSASDKAAEKMAASIADTIENSPRWRLVFPDVVPDKARGWSSTGYHVKDEGVDRAGGAGEWARLRYGLPDASLMAAGVGSSAWNGVRITGLFVGDDMHDRRSKTQQATNDDTVDFFNDTALPRATETAHVVVVQTRWNAKDVIAKIKALAHFVCFEHPAISIGDDGQERSYWPAQWPLERLKAKEAEIGPMVFLLVYQGNDRALEGTVLKTEWLHAFPALEIKREWNRYFGIDFARRLKEILNKDDDPDSFALAVWADTGTRLVLEDVFGGVMFGPEAEDLFFAKAAIYRPKVTGIETNGASAKMFYLELLKRMRAGGAQYVLRPITRSKDKGEYMAIMAPYFASGQALLSDADTPGLGLFRAQWAMFPRGHDDSLDGAYNGWAVASHLLPAGTVPEQQAAAKRSAAYVPVSRVIDYVYR